MTGRRLLWLLPALAYGFFFAWYTNLGGALTPSEIETFITKLDQMGFSADRIQRVRNFMEEDTGRQFLMVNIMDLADQPKPVEGLDPSESSEQVLGRYMEHMWPALLARACHPVISGQAVAPTMDVVGIEGADRWTGAALMRYRSRRDVMTISTDPAFQGKHDYKLAAFEKTIAYPIEMDLYLSDLRFLLGLILLALVSLVDIAVYGSRRSAQFFQGEPPHA